jgi:uncharacterized protein with HEPN domain
MCAMRRWPFRALSLAWMPQLKLDAALAARIPELAQIVAFRNQLIHGYATVRVATVWNVLRNALPPLLAVVEALLGELGQA